MDAASDHGKSTSQGMTGWESLSTVNCERD